VSDPAHQNRAIASEKTGITADTALRLSAVFDTTPEFWLRLRERFELETAQASASDLAQIKRHHVAA
jgi:antitoxin HigA-1